MVAVRKIDSLYRRLLISFVGFISVILIIAMFVFSYIFVEQAEKSIEQNSYSWAGLIAKHSSPYLEHEQFDELNEVLQNANFLPFINYIHVYKVKDNGIEFFTSYNKNSNYPPIANKKNDIASLIKPRYSKDYLELIIPIKKAKEISGR